MAALTAIYVLTGQGAALAEKMAAAMNADIYIPPFLETAVTAAGARKPKTYDSLSGLLGKTFGAYRNHIFIAAACVAVRCIAPHVSSQTIDPAVVAMDHGGKYVVSLLSGQLEGANDLAKTVAGIVGGSPVITSVRDTENVPSFDILALELGLRIGNIKAVPVVNAAIAAGVRVEVEDRHNFLRLRNSAWKDLFDFAARRKSAMEIAADAKKSASSPPRITVTPFVGRPSPNNLVLHPPVLHVGVDGRRGARTEDIIGIIHTSLAQAELSIEAVGAFAVAESRQYEQGIIEAAEAMQVPIRIFTARDIDSVPMPKLKDQPDFGLAAEPLARLGAGENSAMRVLRTAGRGVAIAVAESVPSKQL